MTKCPKCSSEIISGPVYKKDVYGQWLEYSCVRCGYQDKSPTHDATSTPRVPSGHAIRDAFAELSQTLHRASILTVQDSRTVGAALHKLHVAIHEGTND